MNREHPAGPAPQHFRDEGLDYYFHRPDQMPDGYLRVLAELIEAGGVNPKWVRHHLDRAYLIGYAMDGDLIVGVEVLKEPRPEYIQRVKELTGLDLGGYVERGYASVRPEFQRRGILTRMSGGLIERAKDRKTYVVMSSDSQGALKVGARNKARLAAKYHSLILNKEVGVYIQT